MLVGLASLDDVDGITCRRGPFYLPVSTRLPHSLVRIGLEEIRYRIPSGEVEVLRDMVRISYPPPEFDVKHLAGEKFILGIVQDFNESHAIAAIEMRLGGPTAVIPRSEPVLQIETPLRSP